MIEPSAAGAFQFNRLMACAALTTFMVSLAAPASAVSTRVKFACAKDYYANCRSFEPNSAEARACMRSAGERLSSRCVSALIAAGEVSAKEVAQRSDAVGR